MDGVMKAAANWVAGRLGDYRQFDDAGPIPELLQVLLACQRCIGEQDRMTEVGQKAMALTPGRAKLVVFIIWELSLGHI